MYVYPFSDYSTPDSEMETVNLDTDSVMFMKELTRAQSRSDEEGGQLNGFCSPSLESNISVTHPQQQATKRSLSTGYELSCGVIQGCPTVSFALEGKKKLIPFLCCSGSMFSLT